MNKSMIFGVLVTIVVLTIAVLTTSDNFMLFLNGHALAIVGGGTLAAAVLAYPIPDLWRMLKKLPKLLFVKMQNDKEKAIKDILNLAKAYNRGKVPFENAINEVQDDFLKEAATTIYWVESDITKEEIEEILHTRAEAVYRSTMDFADKLKNLSKFPPAFGLLGTTLSMITLLQSLTGSGAKNTIGPAMSAALIATLYGVAFANLIFLPLSENVAKVSKSRLELNRLLVMGLVLILENKPKMFIEEKLKAALLDNELAKTTSAQESNLRKAG